MLQDIAPHKFNNSYKNLTVEKNDRVLIYNDEKIYLSNSRAPLYCDIENYVEKEDLIYLFAIDDEKYFLCLKCNFDSLNLKREDVKIFREFEPKWAAFALITGYSLYKWYSSHKFCGCCGKLTIRSNNERALVCPDCKNIEYPKISPAVIVAVYDKDKILMTKYSNNSYKKYALIAGYAEVGETLEQAAKREVLEEVGLKIKNLKYFNSQPWAPSESLLVGFFAQLDGNNEIKLDKNELKEASWFSKDEITADDTTLSLTWEMIKYFKNNVIYTQANK